MPVKWSKPKTAGAKPKAKKPVNENPSKAPFELPSCFLLFCEHPITAKAIMAYKQTFFFIFFN